ncbi:MAG: hypothetical protein R2882_01240 [Gemmatimonadales bacterium]
MGTGPAAPRPIDLEQLRTEMKQLLALRSAARRGPDQVDALMARLGELSGSEERLETRRRQIEVAEERLAKADGLLADLRQSLEGLIAQKVEVEHFFDRAASLPQETRKVETLIETLREERRLTDRVRSAIAEFRSEPAAELRRHRPTPRPAVRGGPGRRQWGGPVPAGREPRPAVRRRRVPSRPRRRGCAGRHPRPTPVPPLPARRSRSVS